VRYPWIIAIRPKTLPAAAAPVITGTALAYADHSLDVVVAIACLLSALLLQIGSNLANDVFDYERGADTGERLGPTRVTQAGLLTPFQVKVGMYFVFGLTVVLGLYLTWIGGWVILILGVAAILSAIAYTGGPYPLGYHGYGDIFVFIFFGLGATAGTYYLQAGVIMPSVWWMASALGCLIVSILVVNNLRDIENDRKVHKMTMAVRLGVKWSLYEYYVMVLTAYFIPVILWVIKISPPWGILTWLSFPYAFYWMKFIRRTTGKALNKALAGTGKVALIYATLYALGMVLSVVSKIP